MIPSDDIIITLDQPRRVAWTQRAIVRLDSLPRTRRAGPLYKLAAFTWAALVDRNHPFEDPEDLGAYLRTPEQVKAIGEAVVKARERAAESEKNGDGSTPRPSPSSSLGSPPSNSGA